MQRMDATTTGAGYPATVRGFRALGDEEAVLLVAGGKDGYVGRDGHAVEDGA